MMLRTFVFAVLMSSVCFAGDWKLVWSDEFEKEGLPDAKKWGYEEGFVRNKELQFYTRGRTIEELLKIVELESKRTSRVGRLSGGQKQRLSLACALAGDPDLLFLDEPTTGLDPQSRRQLWGILDRFRAGGGTILLTTHYMDEAEVLCDRVAIVDQGKMIALDTPNALISMLGEPRVITHHGTLEDVFMSLTGRHLRED